MQVTESINWTITCTSEFERTVAFFRNIMGLRLAEEGIPVTDTQFTRYALLRLSNGGTLEIVEPANEAVRALYTAPIVCFKVDDLAQARRELADKGAEFVSRTFRAQDHTTWTYFRAPDGHVYQIWSQQLPLKSGSLQLTREGRRVWPIDCGPATNIDCRVDVGMGGEPARLTKEL